MSTNASPPSPHPGQELDEPLLRGDFSPAPASDVARPVLVPPPDKTEKKSFCWLAMVMTLLVLMGCLNFILVKAMYDAFGTSGAFFANQGVNFLYIVYGGAAVLYKVAATNDIDAEQLRFSHWRFLGLAMLDAFGTFFTAMGASYTPLALQQILNQTLIPLTMICSFAFLGTRFRGLAMLGAGLIFSGAAVTVYGSVERSGSGDNEHSTEHFRWYASVIYFLSNVPMALSAVYKEIAFRDRTVDVWYLCFWVSTYQFLVSFAFVPMLGVPFLSGDLDPPPLSALPGQFWDGAMCWVGASPCCCAGTSSNVTDALGMGGSSIEWQGLQETVAFNRSNAATICAKQGQIACPTPLGSAFWLLPGYTLCNFLYNALGLYITKHGSAVLRYISYALILPLATIIGAPVFKENITVFTIIGLVTVVFGFSLYQRFHAMEAFESGGGDKLDSVGGSRYGVGSRSGSTSEAARTSDGMLSAGPIDYGSIGGDDIGALPARGWWEASLSAHENPFMIGSPKYIEWRKSRQVSFQERVIGMGMAHVSVQSRASRATMIRRAAQLRAKESGAAAAKQEGNLARSLDGFPSSSRYMGQGGSSTTRRQYAADV